MTGAVGLVGLALVLALASYVQTTIGFGANLVAITLGAWVAPLPEVLALALPPLVAQTAAVTLRSLPDVRWDLLIRRLAPFVGAGFALGVALIDPANARGLRPALGALVIALAARELTSPPRPIERGAAANAALFVGGVINGVLTTGGPLIVWALAKEALPPRELRATLTAMWLVNNALLVAAMGVRGELTPGTLTSSAALLPAVILGVALGERHAGRVDAETFRRAVWVTLLLAGIPLVFAA